MDDLLAAMEARITAASVAPGVATEAMATVLQHSIQDSLAATSHARGTPTPAAPGAPPAMISGALRDSVHITGHLDAPGYAETRVAPTTIYARIQELGGWAGAGHASYLPPRPYVRPAILRSWAELEAVAIAVFAAAAEGRV